MMEIKVKSNRVIVIDHEKQEKKMFKTLEEAEAYVESQQPKPSFDFSLGEDLTL